MVTAAGTGTAGSSDNASGVLATLCAFCVLVSLRPGIHHTLVNVRLNAPHGMSLDATNSRLLFAELTGQRVRYFDLASSAVVTLAGTGSSGTADGAVATATLGGPVALLLSGSTIYIAEQTNHLLRTLSYSSGCVACGVVSTLFPTAGSSAFVFGETANAAVRLLNSPLFPFISWN